MVVLCLRSLYPYLVIEMGRVDQRHIVRGNSAISRGDFRLNDPLRWLTVAALGTVMIVRRDQNVGWHSIDHRKNAVRRRFEHLTAKRRAFDAETMNETYVFDIHLNGSFDLFVIASGELIAFVFGYGVGGTSGDLVANGILQRAKFNV